MTYNFEEIENPTVNIIEEDGKKILSYQGISDYERNGHKSKVETIIKKIDLSHMKIDVTGDAPNRVATISFNILDDDEDVLFYIKQI